MGQVSFNQLYLMAKKGIVHGKFPDQHNPKCEVCFMSKATRRQWRHKKKKNKCVKAKLTPGQVVSVDQSMSEMPGHVAQTTGTSTEQRHQVATAFVDQETSCTRLQLQFTALAEETVKAKEKFKLHMESVGMKVRHCHADNGVFAANKWRKHCAEARQTLSFAGVKKNQRSH